VIYLAWMSPTYCNSRQNVFDAYGYARTFKIHRNAYNYRGILAYLKMPTNRGVSSKNDYLNWYVGFDDVNGRKVEAGISYTKKYNDNNIPECRKFLNYSGGGNGVSIYNERMTNQPSPGDIIKIKLVKSNSDSYGNCSVSLYIADNLVTTESLVINDLVNVKLVHGTEGNVCKYFDAQFQNAKYQISNGSWYNWTAGYIPFPDTGDYVDPIVVDSEINPMKTHTPNQ
jgi:hypothetical protein